MVEYVNSRKAASKYKILRGKFANVFFLHSSNLLSGKRLLHLVIIQVGKIRGFIQFLPEIKIRKFSNQNQNHYSYKKSQYKSHMFMDYFGFVFFFLL